MKDIVIVGGARTPMCEYSGTPGFGRLKGISAIDLAAHASKAAIERARIDPESIDHVVIGNALIAELNVGKLVSGTLNADVNMGTGKVRYAVAEFEPAWIAAGYLVPIRLPGEDRRIELNALTGSMIFEAARWPDINNPQFIANMDAYLARQK